MNRRTTGRVVAFVGMASLLPFHGAYAKDGNAPGPEEVKIECVAPKHELMLKELRGAYVAIHFAPAAAAGAETLIRSHHEASAQFAGLEHVFIAGAASPEWERLAQSHAGERMHFAVDAGGTLASEFKLDKAAPATVVLDEQGRELFRETGDQANSFKAFAARLKSAWALPARTDYNLPKGSDLAVQGYDVVAYFKDGKPAKGDERYTSEYRGVLYRFASPEHRVAFAASPRQYLPTYGGWCASAIGAKGEKVEIDPTNFKVKDGRLFLFYKSIFADALKDWNKHEQEWEPAADTNWKRISGEQPVKGE